MAWSESDNRRQVGGSDLFMTESAFESGKHEEDYRQTRRTAFTHPSKSGLLVTCAYLPHTTLPPAVTRPSSCGGRRRVQQGEKSGRPVIGRSLRTDTFTSMTVPLVMTPSWVYMGDCGFFLTPMIGSWKVALSSAAEGREERQ